MNISRRSKNTSWKQYALKGKKLTDQVKKGLCFTHHPKDSLIKSGTYFSALSFDKDFVAAATCDPANVNRLVDDQGIQFFYANTLFYTILDFNLQKIIKFLLWGSQNLLDF